MANFSVKNFVIFIILTTFVWNIMTALNNIVNKWFFQLTGYDPNESKAWMILALIYIVAFFLILYILNMETAFVLGLGTDGDDFKPYRS